MQHLITAVLLPPVFETSFPLLRIHIEINGKNRNIDKIF